MYYQIPRRSNLSDNTPAELAIYNAMREVEKLEGNEKLTEAVILLGKARDLVSDYVDASLGFVDKTGSVD